MLVWSPKKYQASGRKWLATRPGAALFWKMGLGKTTAVLGAFIDLQKRKLAKRMLVIAPLRVCQLVWRQEAEKWEQFQGLRIGLAHGSSKVVVMTDHAYDIVLMNYEGILTLAQYFRHFDVVCFDELSRMKATNTRRFKIMRQYLHVFKFRWGLTGTPVPNSLLDLFGQVFILDGGQRLGQFVTKFRARYFYQKPFDMWTWYPKPNTPKEFAKALSDLAHYVPQSEWVKLPSLLNLPITVTLPKEAFQQYKHLEREFILKLKEGTVTAQNAAILSNKLRQAASGCLYDEDRTVHVIHEAKLDALESLVEEMEGDPLIVVVNYLHEVDAIRKRFGKDIPYLGGGVTNTQVDKIIGGWALQAYPIMIVHPVTMSRGVNLQGGGHAMCWYSYCWSMEDYTQMIARLHRQGQEEKVLNYSIIANGTIDDYVRSVLEDKSATQDKLLKGLKTYYNI